MITQHELLANKALVKNFLNALSSMKVDDAREMIHEECVFHIPNITMKPNTYNGPEMLKFVAGLKDAIPDGIRFEYIEMTAEEDRVTSIVNGYSTTIDGTDYNNKYHFLHTIKDGKIIKQMEYIDSYLGAKVLGPILKRLAE